MIVQCDQCQTRFKIPDEKVTAKGVKVRCTKCQHTFRVSRPADAAAKKDDPFAAFGPTPSRPPAGSGSFSQGHGASTPPPTGPSFDELDAPTRVGQLSPDLLASLRTPEGTAAVMGSRPSGPASFAQPAPPSVAPADTQFDPFALDAEPTTRTKPSSTAALDPFGLDAPPTGRTKSVTARAPDPFGLDAPPTGRTKSVTAPARDPFGLDALPTSSSPAASFDPFGFDAPPTGRTKSVTASAADPFDLDAATTRTLSGAAPAPDPFGLDAPPTGRTRSVTAPAPDPFDLEALPTSRTKSMSSPEPDPFGLDAPPTMRTQAVTETSREAFHLDGPPPPTKQLTPPPGDPFELDAGKTRTRALTPPPKGGFAFEAEMSSRTPAPFDPFAAGSEQADPFGADALTSDPFGSDAADVTDPGRSGGFAGEADARALFDIPSKPARTSMTPAPIAAGAAPARTMSDGAVPLGTLKLKKMASPQVAEAEAPAARPVGRSVFGAILNLAVAAALVLALFASLAAYTQGGRIDESTFTVENLKSLFAPRAGWVPVDVSNGLYVTREGREIFYVRGEAENRAGAAGRVRVHVEILDGDQRVKTASVLAGLSASPEQLHEIATSEQLDELRELLDEKGQEIAPGARAPFLVPFFEYPPNLASYRLRVTIVPDEGRETAAR